MLKRFLLIVPYLVCAVSARAQPDADYFLRERRDMCLEKSANTPEQRLAACNDAIGMNWYQHRDLARLYFSRSTLLAEKGETEAALADTKSALKAWGNIVNDVINRAALYIHEKKYDVAIGDLDLANIVVPDSYPILTNRAAAHLHRGDLELAAQDLAAAKAIKPESPKLALLGAELAERKGDIDGALSLFDRVIEQNPKLAGAYNERCYLRALVKRELGEKALPDCEHAVELAPGNPAMLDSRGYVRFLLGRYADAIADFDAALTLYPKLSASLYGRGLAKEKLGDSKGSADDIAAAEAIEPGIGKKFGTPAMMTR
jgi:tetratricopeptide (TPR) repeat protein